MPMRYEHSAIVDGDIPRAAVPLLQHAIDTYASESNKVVSVWRELGDEDLAYRPHARARTVLEVMQHQLLSERRFFAEFLGTSEPAPADVLPAEASVTAYAARFLALAQPRLATLASQPEEWWTGTARFFDVDRARAWILWRRILHTAHHRTQLTVYLKLMDRRVPATYGPTADVTWDGADPTNSVEAAGRG